MPKSRKKKKSPKRVLALLDLEQAKSAVLNTRTSKTSQQTSAHAITEFVEWYCSVPRVAVNISIRQFRAAGFVDQLRAILRSMGMAPQALELEITEALLHESNSQATAMMAPLDALGVSFALDDFGRGYSSLAALKRFPMSRIKIDQSFVADLVKRGDAESVAGAIIAMAHGLGKRVVAEGVETEWHAAALVRLGCDHFQGHFCGRPLRAADFTRFLNVAAARERDRGAASGDRR